MMNWAFVLFGNILMDSAIAIFAMLSGVEAYYRRKYEKEEIDKIKELIKEEKDAHPKMKISFATRYLSIAEICSPVTSKKITAIILLFVVGIIFQIIGIIGVNIF